MPLLEEPDEKPIQEFITNQSEYARIKSRLPEFVTRGLPKALHPSVNLLAVSDNYKIPFWQFNKIREITKKIFHSHGMRVRFKRYDTFLWGMALSLPDFYIVDTVQTTLKWEENPTEWMWRKILISGIPNDLFQGLLNLVPLKMDDTMLGAWWGMTTRQQLTVFEHFAYKNTMATEIIICNWDIILDHLNKNGY